MAELLDEKAIQQLRRRLDQYEKLLAQRKSIDRKLEALTKELGPTVASAPAKAAGPRRLTAAQKRAISQAMKRRWEERKKKQAGAAQVTSKPLERPAAKSGKGKKPPESAKKAGASVGVKKESGQTKAA